MTIFLLRKARFFIMDQLLDILTEVNSDVDYETCDTLVDDGILDSFDAQLKEHESLVEGKTFENTKAKNKEILYLKILGQAEKPEKVSLFEIFTTLFLELKLAK